MDDLPAFLLARLDERARAANAMKTVYPTPWDTSDRGWMARIVADGPNFPEVIRLEQDHAPGGSYLADWIQHVELSNPDFVLADVAAKRQIIAEHRTKVFETIRGAPEFGRDYWCQTCHVPGDQHGRTWCPTLRLLALPDAGHPDYQESWRP